MLERQGLRMSLIKLSPLEGRSMPGAVFKRRLLHDNMSDVKKGKPNGDKVEILWKLQKMLMSLTRG